MSHLLFPSSTALLEIHSSSVRGENTHSPALSPSKAALKAEAMIESPDPRRSRSFSRFPLELCAPSPAATQTRGRVADELGEAAAELTCGAPPTASSRWPFSRLSRACVCLFADATFGNFFGRQKVPLAIFRGYNPPPPPPPSPPPPPPAALEAFLASGIVLQNGGEGHAAMPSISPIAGRKIKSAVKGVFQASNGERCLAQRGST